MDQANPNRRNVRTYTVAALLGLFVVAVVVALIGKIVPGGLPNLAKRALGHDSEKELGEE
jgi:hypothetical protein